MKNTIAALSAALLTSLLAACTASATPASTVTVTAQPSPPAPAPTPLDNAPDIDEPSMSDDDLYLVLLRGEDPFFNAVDDGTLLDLGQATCDALDAGMTLDMYAAVAARSGVTTQQAATIAAASIVIYCPWHEGIAG